MFFFIFMTFLKRGITSSPILVRICPLYHIAVIGPIGRKSSFSMKNFFII